MEKARQHPALTREQWIFGLVWFSGPISLGIAILLALFVGQPAIVVGIVIQAISRAIVALWSAVRPNDQISTSPIWWRFTAAAIWIVLAAGLVWTQVER